MITAVDAVAHGAVLVAGVILHNLSTTAEAVMQRAGPVTEVAAMIVEVVIGV